MVPHCRGVLRSENIRARRSRVGVRNEDEILVQLFKALSLAAFRKRAAISLVELANPLCEGLPCRLRNCGGEIVYEQNSCGHRLIRSRCVDGGYPGNILAPNRMKAKRL